MSGTAIFMIVVIVVFFIFFWLQIRRNKRNWGNLGSTSFLLAYGIMFYSDDWLGHPSDEVNPVAAAFGAVVWAGGWIIGRVMKQRFEGKRAL